MKNNLFNRLLLIASTVLAIASCNAPSKNNSRYPGSGYGHNTDTNTSTGSTIENETKTKLLSGAGVPDNTIGKYGDTYVDKITKDYYVKNIAQWEKKGNINSIEDVDGSFGLHYMPLDNNAFAVESIGDCISNDIVIPSKILGFSIISIGNTAFEDCSSLTSITIPNSVTSIGDYAFENCSSLTSITIPDSVISIGYYAFNNCPNLHYNEFDNCYYLGNETNPYLILIKCFNNTVSSVTIDDGCRFIYSDAFYYCSSLTSITIPDSVISIGDSAFSGCSSLTSITIPNSVTSIGDYVFENCSSLTSITIPNSVTSIGRGAFYGCSSLTSIVIPNSVTSIGAWAFTDCSSLTSLLIPKNVISIGEYAFLGCYSLTSITVEEGNPVYDSRDNCNAIIATSIKLLIVGCQNTVIPNSVASIGYGAFYNCSSLTSITIPNSVTSIGISAFSDCSSLTSIVIPNSVTSIGRGAFYGCSSLTSIVIPNSVASIGEYAFKDCSSLTIYCEASSQPSGWYSFWNPDDRPVVWGYTVK